MKFQLYVTCNADFNDPRLTVLGTYNSDEIMAEMDRALKSFCIDDTFTVRRMD